MNTFDQKKLIEHFSNDLDIIKELITVLSATYETSINNLIIAVDDRNIENIKLESHTIKGMVSNFFAIEIKEIAEDIEINASKYEMDILKDKTNQILKQFPILISELHNFVGVVG